MTPSIYVRIANKYSPMLWDFVGSSNLLAAVAGASIGDAKGKMATYGFHAVLGNIFWKYIQPRTFGKVFMHPQSNDQAICVGFGLSYVTSVAISYLFNKCILPNIPENIPFLGRIKKENETNPPATVSDACCLTAVPTVITALRVWVMLRG
jgi:hypothetical protein